ncbi:MAG: response regulator transcription factor [Gammaproteobacteria bacterium]
MRTNSSEKSQSGVPLRILAQAEQTVFIVDDDEDVRASLVWLFESAGLAVRSFASAEVFLASREWQRPGCLVLDLRMPGMDGAALFERLQEQGRALPVIFLSAHGDIPTTVRLVQRGAFDFVEKPFAEGEIVAKVKKALSRNRLLRARERERAELRKRLARLTGREREVLDRVTRGQANKVIAIELGIAQKTVEIHRSHVMHKMGARTLVELIGILFQEAKGNPL